MKDRIRLKPGGTVEGACIMPGDKSMSHRALILSALANGRTKIDGFLEAEDTIATLLALQQLGIEIEGPIDGSVIVIGKGKDGLCAPEEPIYLGNSGTSMRLLMGVLAAQSFSSILLGDDSLSARPMARVIDPLVKMGAVIDSKDGYAPIEIQGNSSLQGMHYQIPMASSQVKSALLLAGLFASGETKVIEPSTTRDHTERMLSMMGYPLVKSGHSISLQGNNALTPYDFKLPGDFSSAAFFIVAATITPNSSVLLKNVGINPTRTGLITILNEMGADISYLNKRLYGDEPVADIQVNYCSLRGIDVPSDYVSLAIDEFPAIFVAASVAGGRTVIKNAAELRVKECDRIAVMTAGLKSAGADIEEFEDGVVIQGKETLNGGCIIDAHHDHRVAMAMMILAFVAKKPIELCNCSAIATSFPTFDDVAKQLGLNFIEKEHG